MRGVYTRVLEERDALRDVLARQVVSEDLRLRAKGLDPMSSVGVSSYLRLADFEAAVLVRTRADELRREMLEGC